MHSKQVRSTCKKEETLLEYVHVLMEIAKPVNLDEESSVEYFVKGVPDA